MQIEEVFIGDIRKCNKYEMHPTFKSETFINGVSLGCDCFGFIETDSEPYKENATILKIKNGGYVDLDNLKTIIDCWKVDSLMRENGGYSLKGIMMSTSESFLNGLFVDEKSLKPYFKEQIDVETMSLRKVRRAVKNHQQK